MKSDDQPEDVLLQYEEAIYNEMLNKYFDGEVPTQKQKIVAINFLTRTKASQYPLTTNQNIDYSSYFETQ